ncbi:uncharacterized protein B0H18DRAFT_1018378 [Fomitopsis serialis]|uniref:uncharacterized protein n=1 Tax=Fomitopsis serialis TaxID=139415 RepID=UPI0020074CF0|nr:uncharacterized protein B0H18DRAFT_1018378 [Neoantrodia serialis]KAH9922175.1 hypothetical protein B0H18DRAFT_1018378 [Neoantrodia serialis]
MAFLRSLSALVACLSLAWTSNGQGPYPGQIKNLVTFGDSYSDVYVPGDNGTSWPTYAAMYGNFTLYPFAKSGATCSNYLTYKPFPPVFEYQLPLYFTEKYNGSLELDPTSTIYTLWIGTNDVGVNALLTGRQTPGVTLWVKVLYTSGARNFVFQNMLPLQDTILYSADSYPNRYWTAERNSTEWNVMMTEITNTGNALGAHLGYFNSFGLVADIRANPQNYLNGTAPLNVTGCINSCVYQLNENTAGPVTCDVAEGTARDSFLWYSVSGMMNCTRPSRPTGSSPERLRQLLCGTRRTG